MTDPAVPQPKPKSIGPKARRLLAEVERVDAATTRASLAKSGVSGFTPAQLAEDRRTLAGPLVAQLSAVRASVFAAKVKRQRGRGRPGGEDREMAALLSVWPLHGDRIEDVVRPLLATLAAIGATPATPTETTRATKRAVSRLRHLATCIEDLDRRANSTGTKPRPRRKNEHARFLAFALTYWLPCPADGWPGFAFMPQAALEQAANFAFRNDCPAKRVAERVIEKSGLKRSKLTAADVTFPDPPQTAPHFAVRY